jgi:hypothetical protein
MLLREAERRNDTPRAGRTPLWHDLQGKTGYRVFGALILDELCQGTDLSMSALLRRLRQELDRPMSRQTLVAWRSGDQATPNDVMLASAAIVRRTLADAAITVVMRVLSDPEADPRFAEGLRFYYGHGRPEAPAEGPSWLVRQVGETKRRRSAPSVGQTPLWRDHPGKTSYRVFAALILDELCKKTDINTEELRRRLRQELHRPLSRQTLAAWRRGDQSVPNDVLLATGAIVHRTLAEASLVVVVKVLGDPDADPHLADRLREYHSNSQGRA